MLHLWIFLLLSAHCLSRCVAVQRMGSPENLGFLPLHGSNDKFFKDINPKNGEPYSLLWVYKDDGTYDIKPIDTKVYGQITEATTSNDDNEGPATPPPLTLPPPTQSSGGAEGKIKGVFRGTVSFFKKLLRGRHKEEAKTGTGEKVKEAVTGIAKAIEKPFKTLFGGLGEGSFERLRRTKSDVITDDWSSLTVSGLRYWPDAVVPVQIREDQFGPKDKMIIKDALKMIERKTCIRFRTKVEEDQNYVVVEDTGPDACWSYVGIVSSRMSPAGNQTLSLGKGCVNTHTVLHEFCHVLGFEHMHNAPDRDDYITIHWENIRPGGEDQFVKLTWDEFNDFGLGYDYYSVVHYGPMLGAKSRNNPSFTPKDPTVTINEISLLSKKDILKLNLMYCDDNSGNSTPRRPDQLP